MDDLLEYAKVILLFVLLYDVIILFRKPEPGSEIITLNFWKEIERKGIDLMDYDKRYGKYRLKLSSNDLKKHRDFIKDLVRKSKGIPLESETKNEE